MFLSVLAWNTWCHVVHTGGRWVITPPSTQLVSTSGTLGDRRSQAPNHKVKDHNTIMCGFVSTLSSTESYSSKKHTQTATGCSLNLRSVLPPAADAFAFCHLLLTKKKNPIPKWILCKRQESTRKRRVYRLLWLTMAHIIESNNYK